MSLVNAYTNDISKLIGATNAMANEVGCKRSNR
jgi:hypothetical protein